ncbi:uncharacterized protein LOC119168222 [Rhipicephalus microplus]|uniref:uncharacterized protein LOC119168222 n=1 Tax=Rhipicephalus microplus TaxID=6941 RepID=UPI003F6CA5AE
MSTDSNKPFVASTCEKPLNCGQQASPRSVTSPGATYDQGGDSGRTCVEQSPFWPAKKTDFSINGLLSPCVRSSSNPSSNTGSSHYSATRAPATVRADLLARPAAFEFARTCDKDQDQVAKFEWLQCSRYKPPKIPRAAAKRRKERKRIDRLFLLLFTAARRRELPRRRYVGRNPRIPFSGAQVSALEAQFAVSRYLSGAQVNSVATRLGLTEQRVKIWFQNRRAREKRERQPPDAIEHHSAVLRSAAETVCLTPAVELDVHSELQPPDRNISSLYTGGVPPFVYWPALRVPPRCSIRENDMLT